uniref:Uncharacterized protein n=1 Tax=Plectus sambesii TaxID=2011161 RepID=A0A914V147_9BILA
MKASGSDRHRYLVEEDDADDDDGSKTSMTELKDNKLYTDRNITLKQAKLKVKRFYWPLMLPKSVKIEDVVAVYHEPHSRRDLRICRDWGLSVAGVHWAADGRRVFWTNPKRSNVTMKLRKEKIHIGFTVEHIEEFLEVLRPLLPQNVPIESEFPYFKKSEGEYQRLTT